MNLRPLAPILAFAALLASGCGTTTEIDKGRAEKFVKGAFTAAPRSVDCPDGVEAKPGKTLTCKVVRADGRRFDVVLHIVDKDGRVKVGAGDVRPAP
jgi:hypothetical protein